MDLLMFGLVAMGFGAYSTYLLATSLPEEVLDVAAKHCRFAGVGGDTVHEDDTRLAINRLSERKASCLPTCPAKKTSSDHFLRRKRARANYKDAQYAPGDYEAIISQRPIAVHAFDKMLRSSTPASISSEDAARCAAQNESGCTLPEQ